MTNSEKDMLAAEKGLNVPKEIDQLRAETFNRNVQYLFNLLRGVQNGNK